MKRPVAKQKILEKEITNNFYGRRLIGTKIYFDGFKELPKFIKDDGSFPFGKHILEALLGKYKKPKLIFTNKNITEKKTSGKTTNFYLCLSDYEKIKKLVSEKSTDIKHRAVNKIFSDVLPKEFSADDLILVYFKGHIAEVLHKDFLPTNLSNSDIEAIENFIPKIVGLKIKGSDSSKTILSAKNSFELSYLEELLKVLINKIKKDKAESSWQDFFKEKILILQDGYIKFIDKLNVDLGDNKYPDFILVTGDSYIDILEIKTPNTPLLSYDKSHSNFYWSPDLSKAIAQTEKYINIVTQNTDRLRNHIRDKYKIDLNIIRPRGLIIAGSSGQFKDAKEAENDFRLLNNSLKNITVITYDDFVTRLRNRIYVLKSNTKSIKKKKK